MSLRDKENNLNLNMFNNSNQVISFTNHFKEQSNEINLKQDSQLNPFNNNNYSQANNKTEKVEEQQSQNAFVFDITHSFAKENFINQGNQNNNDQAQQYQGITGSSCSSIQQLSHRVSTSNNNLYPSKNNISTTNQQFITSQTNQNNPLNTQFMNTQQSITALGSQIKLGYDDLAKSPCKSNLFALSCQGQNNFQQQQQQEQLCYNNNSNGITLSNQSPPTHQKIPSMIVHPVTQQQQDNKSTLFIPLNQLLGSNQEQSIIQNNSSIICNTNAKSSYRSNSTTLNNNSQVNLNVRSILNNNSNFEFNNIISNNNFNANNSSLNNNNFQITNNNYSNANINSSNNNGILSSNSINNNSFKSNNVQFNTNAMNKSNLDETKMNLTAMEITNRSFIGEQQQNVTNNNNKSILNGNNNNNISFVANCNNTTIMKALEKNMDVSQQQVQHLINSSQQLQHTYTIEVERYMELLNDLKEKQEKCENKQKKKKRELEEIENMIKQVENKQQYERMMILSSEESRKQRVELTFNNHQQLDTVLQKIKNLISVIPDVKMHEKFFASTQPLESVLKQLSENKRDIIMHLLRERDEQMKFNECLNALREDFNSYIMQNTEYTLLYEEQSEVFDSVRAQYPTESEYISKKIELNNSKEFLQQKLSEIKSNYECIQSEIQYKEQKISKLNENSQFLQTRLEQARKNKQSAPDYMTYENQFQLFLSESFDENAKQFYKDFIRIFDTDFLQTSIAQSQGDTNNLITKVIQFQALLLQETYLVLQNQTTLNCEDLRKIQDQKRELMIELNQVDLLREVILSILSYDQLLLNVSMCVRNMKRKDIVMQTFYQYLMSKKTQFSFKFQAQNDITSVTEDYMRVNKDLLNLEGEKKTLQFQLSETLKDINHLKNQLQQINSSIESNENNFKIHFAKECASYYDQYLVEKNIIIKDISFTYGKAYVEKLEQDIKEEFQKANNMHLERIKEQIFSLNQNMQKVTDKRQKNFRFIEDEIKPQYEEYKRKQSDCDQKQQCLSIELADIISKERVYIQQLNCILAEQFDLKNKKYTKGSTFSNLQELMQQSEDEALTNYNQTLQLMLKQNTQKQQGQEISIFNQLQLFKEKMNAIQEELQRMTRNDIEVIAQIEQQLTKSESVMKEFHSKIEQIHSVLKDQLSKMNVDSETIFNTFNLNFSNQVLTMKDLINRNQDRMKIIVNLTKNSKVDSKKNGNNDNDESTKRSRCSKSMYIDAPKNFQKQQTNHNQSQIQYNNSNNNSYIEPKYGKITIDMNALNILPDTKTNSNSNYSTSLTGSAYPFNQNKENQQPLNFSSKGINWQLPQNKFNQSQKDDMLSSNSSEAFFQSNSSKSNRMMASSRSQSQIFLGTNRQNSNGMITSGRIPSSILSDPLYNEITSTSSIQGNNILSSGQQQNNNFVAESNKSTKKILSSSNLNMSSINSPPSLSASKSKQLFKRANSFNNTSSQQLNNNSSGNIAQQIHKITNSNNFKKPLNRNNSNLLFTNWNNQNGNNTSNGNLNYNMNNTFRDYSPNNKNVLQNYNLQPAYNNSQKVNSKQNNDQDRSEQNITLNLSHINHIHNGSTGNTNYNNNTNNHGINNNLIHNNSLLHNISMNNNTNIKNQEQVSAFLDISSLNMISATNRNDNSGIFTQTLSTNINNNSKIFNKNSNFLNDNKNSLYEDNSFCLNTNNDRSMLMSENNNQRVLNTSQNKRLNSISSQQMNTSKLSKKQSISGLNSQSNIKYIEIYKMYGVGKDNLIRKQIYDPINNTAKPTSFGYAKRFLRINEKTQNLEIVKEDIINQQPRKIIEQAYNKLLVKNIHIPSITSSILDYKNDYRFKEPEDEIIQKFVNCNNLPFSIEIEKMGKIECIALHEEDLLYLMKQFCQ